MIYRFIDPDGREVAVEDTSGIRRAIQEGRLQPDSLMFQQDTGRWAAAAGHPAYRRVLRTAQGPRREDLGPAHPPSRKDDTPELRSAAVHTAPTGAEPHQLRTWQILALAGVLVIGFLSGRAITDDPAGLIGAVIGAFLGSALFAGVFMVWSHRTRPYLPFGMLAVALLSLLGGNLERSQLSSANGQLEELEALVDRWEEEYGLSRAIEFGAPLSTGPSPEEAPPSASGSTDERAMWAALRLLEAIEEIQLEYEAKHNVGEEHLKGWLEPHYFANASEYPEIPAYFNRIRAFFQDLIDNLEAHVMTRMDEIMDRASLPAHYREEFQRSFLDGLRVNSLENSGTGDLALGFASTAKELHEVLLANEHLIEVSQTIGIAEIRDSDLEEYVLDLVHDLNWYTSQVAERQEVMMRNMRDVLAQARDAQR